MSLPPRCGLPAVDNPLSPALVRSLLGWPLLLLVSLLSFLPPHAAASSVTAKSATAILARTDLDEVRLPYVMLCLPVAPRDGSSGGSMNDSPIAFTGCRRPEECSPAASYGARAPVSTVTDCTE